jgi:hypothetical protein
MVDIEKLEELVYYAVDKGSPFKLKVQPATDTLEKISHYEFAELEMIGPGVQDMWQTINANVVSYAEGRKVTPADQKKCKTVADVWKAVCKSAGVAAVTA